ncbi:MFS family permease [Sphingobium sp. B7D2B]|uniref:spinster family MFS transporter n=1 Tax=Sphingobium sp. B7D2B TaxID=2940583 RepID=UPI002224FA17|nr:MFS transporter [Sphingobium sp. B7D2B]MCW2365077.1 MFS family permease [Sphingobium sp. B7D2B]
MTVHHDAHDPGVSQATAASTPGTPADDADMPTRAQAHYSLFVLTVVVLFTVVDRQVLALLILPVQRDFGISDTQAALLLGAAFSLTYAIAGLPIARIADTRNRRNIVAACIAFWSGATMLCGLAQNYTHLFLARMGIGAGESGYGPATWSIVTDSYPREKVAFGTGVLSIGATVGTGLALFMGGAVLAMVEHFPTVSLPFGGTIRPWQWAFIIVGAPGLIWALVVLTTKEPARRGLKGRKLKSVPVKDVARFMRDDWRVYLAAIGGLAMKLLMVMGISQWMPTLYHREFGWELSDVGMITGGIAMVLSPIALLLGARVSERWMKQGRSDANLRIVFYGLCVSVPCYIVAPLLPNPWIVLTLQSVAVFVSAMGAGPAIAAFQLVTPNSMRAQVSSVSQFCTNVLAFAVGPLLVAILTDYLFRDPQLLNYSISLSTALLGPLTLLITWQGLKPFARSVDRMALEAGQ